METAAQRDGDRRPVGRVFAVAVHPAVPSGAGRLRGETAAVEAPRRRAAVATEGEAVSSAPSGVTEEPRRADCVVPLWEIKGGHLGLQLGDVVQVNSIRAKMATPLVCNERRLVFAFSFSDG